MLSHHLPPDHCNGKHTRLLLTHDRTWNDSSLQLWPWLTGKAVVWVGAGSTLSPAESTPREIRGTSVSTCRGHNTVPQTGGLNNRTLLEAGSPRSRCWKGWPLPVACGRRPSPRALVPAPPVCICVLLPLLAGPPVTPDQGPPQWPHCTFIASLKNLSPNTVTFGGPGG